MWCQKKKKLSMIWFHIQEADKQEAITNGNRRPKYIWGFEGWRGGSWGLQNCCFSLTWLGARDIDILVSWILIHISIYPYVKVYLLYLNILVKKKRKTKKLQNFLVSWSVLRVNTHQASLNSTVTHILNENHPILESFGMFFFVIALPLPLTNFIHSL